MSIDDSSKNQPIDPSGNGRSRPSHYHGGTGFTGGPPGYGGANGAAGNGGDEDEIDLKQLFNTLWQYKWVIVGITALFTILAGVYAFTRMPIYQSEGTMLIKQSQNQYSMAGSDLQGLLSSSYGLGVGSTVANELQVLKSRKLSMEIAQTLFNKKLMDNGRLYPVLWREYQIDSTLTSVDTTVMRIRDNLNVSLVNQKSDVVNLTFKSPSKHEAKRVVDLAMQVYKDLSTRQTRESASSALSFLDQEKKQLQRRLSQAEDSLQQFMNENQLVKVEPQTEELIKNIAELESKKQEVRVKLVAARSGIERYQNELNKIKPGLADQFSDAVGPKMQRYQYQLAELETERMLLLSENPKLTENSDNPELNRLDKRIASMRKEIDKLSQSVLSKGDQFAANLSGQGGSVAAQVTKFNQKLIELQIEQSQYESQQEVIDQRLAELNRRFENLPDDMIRLAQLKREVKIAEELYLTIAKQTSQTALWEQTQFGKGRTIDTGYMPMEPVEPNKKLYVLIGFVLGGLISLGSVFAKEAMNTSIDGVEKLRNYPYPVLSVIPDMTETIEKEFEGKQTIPVRGRQLSTTLISLLDSISPSAEAFRRLHNNIMHSDPDEDYKTLMVSSSSKGEGKTNVISNLAVILAEAGKKVLLVDLDLRRPNVHRMFGIPSADSGIVEVLFEQATVEEAIQSSAVERVDILPCGERPLSPASISHSQGLSELIRGLQERGDYDHILIDTAPYGIITDAGPLIELSDGVILVARFAVTEQAQLDHAIENLQRINAPVVGSVLTAFNYKKSTDSYYSKGYYQYSYKDYSKYQQREEAT